MRPIPGDDVAFALTADAEPLDRQAYVLVRSLRDHYPDAPIVCFVPEGGLAEIDPAIRTYLEAETELTTGPFPIPDYPLSALHAAFVELPERYPDAGYYVALDTDTVLVNPLTLPDTDAECYLAPNIWSGAGHWASVDGPREPWLALFDRFGVDPPDRTETVRARVDGEEMWPPYYNGGCIVATDPTLPERWLEITRGVLDGDEVPGEPFIAEQIALAVVAAEREVGRLGDRQHFRLVASLSVPDDVELLHYQVADMLATLRNPTVKRRLEGYGVRFRPRPVDWPVRLLSWTVLNAGRVVGWRLRNAYWRLAQPVFDWNNPY